MKAEVTIIVTERDSDYKTKTVTINGEVETDFPKSTEALAELVNTALNKIY